jgi:hypothetical protein
MQVYNPLTGRLIKKGGPTYNKLLQQNYKASSFQKAKPWKELAPKSVGERRKLYETCGAKCFLGKETVTKTGKKKYKYPVCKKCVGNQCDCQVLPQGLNAAKARATLVSGALRNRGKANTEHRMVIKKAKRMLKK